MRLVAQARSSVGHDIWSISRIVRLGAFMSLRSSWSVKGKKAGESLQRRFRSIVLHAFRIGFRGLGGDTDRKKKPDDEAVTRPHTVGEFASCLCQEDAAVGPGGRQTLPLEAGDALARGRM